MPGVLMKFGGDPLKRLHSAEMVMEEDELSSELQPNRGYISQDD
jgi:hypothetical protein